MNVKFWGIALLLLAACNVEDGGPVLANNSNANNTSNNTTNNGSNNTTNNTTNNATNNATNNTTNNANACDTCTDEQVCFEEACCTPLAVCPDDACGMVDDGCGGTLDCGVCGCFNGNHETFCPSRPCEVAIGCDENRECVYTPMVCGGMSCECNDGNCDDTSIRDCRDPQNLSCPADFCDPSPMMTADGVVYQNLCVQPDGAQCDFSNLCIQGACNGSTCEEAECGLCNMGAWDCAPNTTTATCYDIPAPGAAAVNCNDNSAASTFIFVDHVNGTDAQGSGSRTQPFKTLDAAMAAAKSRGANGVVVRSGYVHTGLLTIENGISIYGGFGADWKPDGGDLTVNATSPNFGTSIVGARATGVTTRTVLYRVKINAGSPSANGASSYGLHATNSSGLVLEESSITAGNGANGRDGRSGATGKDGGIGGFPTGQSAGVAGVNASCPTAVGGIGGIGGRPGNSSGGDAPAHNGVLGGKGGGVGQQGGRGNSPVVLIIRSANGVAGVHNPVVDMGAYLLVSGDGANGSNGNHGLGGSGGGGGGGNSIANLGNFGGGGGGGGGAGGCGGTAGEGGSAGGGSFGLFLIGSTGMELHNTTVTSGNAGRGGNGGVGGDGGGGGAGGPGAVVPLAGAGGVGGSGTAGQGAGHGGGGAGADTYAVWCENTTLTPTADVSLVYGTAGAGGTSSGNAGAAGQSGDMFGCTL